MATTETPPQAQDIERAVLGAMLFERESIDVAVEKLKPEAFYNPAHAIVFEAMLELRDKDMPVDILTLIDEIKKRDVLDRIGGEVFIAGLCGELTGAANIEHHCDILNEKLSKRKLLGLALSVKALCYEEASESEDIASMLYTQSISVLEQSTIAPYRTMPDVINDTHAIIMQRASSDKATGIPSGIPTLDKYLDGWQKEKLIILAARPSQGKSALAFNFAVNAARCGFPVGVFSLEMPDTDIGLRMVASGSRFNISNIRYQKPSDVEWDKITETCSELTRLPIVIDDTSCISIDKIGAKIRRMQRDHDVKLVVIDYLQLMEGKRSQSREQEVASISRGLKLIAGTLKIPLIVLSQLSRKADGDDEPQLSYLRDSGTIEQDSDIVIFIHNPSQTKKTEMGIDGTDMDNIRQLLVRKNRGGPLGNVMVRWMPEYTTFYELEM